MTDKQLPKRYKKALDDIETICTELLNQLKRKEQECVELKKQVCSLRPELKSIINKTCCKYNIEAKNYHKKIIEIIKNLDKYEQTLAEIKPILEIYANTKVGEEQLDGTSQVVIEDSGVLGSICLKFDPNPARQALQRINGEKNDLHRIFCASK